MKGMKMSKAKRSGPFTSTELDFIRINSSSQSPEWIAEELGRNVDTVVKIIAQSSVVGQKSEILDLKKRQDWQQIQQEFTDEEIEIFKSHWVGICSQFKEEIYYTESLQIIAAIKHDILSNRVLLDQMKIKDKIIELEIELEKEKEEDPPSKDRISNIELQMASYSAAEQANLKEFRESNQKLMNVLRELKSTREQRLVKVEDMKTNFGSLMRTIIESPTIKREFGSYMEKNRLAMDLEFQRLAQLHKFSNGEYDRPILNFESIELKDDENNG